MPSSKLTDTAPQPAVIRIKPWILESNLSHRDRRRIGDLLMSHRQVVLDLAEVTTTSGAGLHQISEWATLARASGGAVVLTHCSMPLLSLLAILRISRSVRIFATLAEAVASFEPRPKAFAQSV